MRVVSPIDPQLLTLDASITTVGVLTEVTDPSQDTAMEDAAESQPAGTEDLRYTCPICGIKKSRRYTIKQHFPECAKKNGNPNGLEWTSHATTKDYKPRPRASMWNKDRAKWRQVHAGTIVLEKSHEAAINSAKGKKSKTQHAARKSEMSMQREQNGSLLTSC